MGWAIRAGPSGDEGDLGRGWPSRGQARLLFISCVFSFSVISCCNLFSHLGILEKYGRGSIIIAIPYTNATEGFGNYRVHLILQLNIK